MMLDPNTNWRHHRWFSDGHFCESEDAPLLRALIEKYNKFWDGKFWYQFHGYKRYIIQWPDWRNHLRIPEEKAIHRHDPHQKKLIDLELEVLK